MILAVAAQAQTDSRLQDLMSRDYARSAEKALSQGDRRSALIFALRALPPDPTEADFARFPEAHDAMRAAWLSRSIRLPIGVETSASFNAEGTRVATSSFIFAGSASNPPPHSLWSTDGTLITQLLPITDTINDGIILPGPSFDPTGRFIVATAANTGLLHVWDGVTGAPRHVINLGNGPETYYLPHTFSASGNMLALSGEQSLFIIDLQTGQLRDRLSGQVSFFYPVGSAGGDSLYALEISLDIFNPGQGSMRLVVYSGGFFEVGQITGIADVTTLLSGVDVINFGDPTRFMIRASDGTVYMIRYADAVVESQLETLAALHQITGLSRGGRAVVAVTGTEEADLVVTTLSGQRIEPEFEDRLQYLSQVFSPEGIPLSFSALLDNDARARFAALPPSPQLYAQIWASLGPQAQATINADRVPR
ncbi:MAG: WD40 repeat domain-containing protein [Pseudomonadota bacterium]